MRIERDRNILSDYIAIANCEVTSEDDPFVEQVLEDVDGDSDNLVLNIINGRTYFYHRLWNGSRKK